MRERRRARRSDKKNQDGEGMSIKNALYIAGTIFALGIIAFLITIMAYNNSLERVYDEIGTKEIGDLSDLKNIEEEKEIKVETASSDIRKDDRRDEK